MSASLPDIPVVYFHSVAPARHPSWVRSYLTLELQWFESFLKYLARRRRQTISLDEYHHIRKQGKKPAAKVCCLTFDDGFLDNYIYAWPLLKKYGFQATIFVNPDFVDQNRAPAPTLEEVWGGRLRMEDIERWGYLTWDEMRLMQASGVIDIQSHTLTHTKYYVSDRMTGIHHPGADCLYPVGNLYPERKPRYIGDADFERLLPYGTPFFEEASAVVARRVEINPEFNRACVQELENHDWTALEATALARRRIAPLYEHFRQTDRLVLGLETEKARRLRVEQELRLSRRRIEAELGKEVRYLCWPHGDNSPEAHQMALEAGYWATTTGSKQQVQDTADRIAARISVGVVAGNRRLTNLKTGYRLGLASGKPAYRFIQSLADLRHR